MKLFNKWVTLWPLLLLLTPMSATARDGGTTTGTTTGLENYIQLGIANNLTLQQQNISLSKSLQALKEAKGMFLPSISIEARYSRAGGGRSISIPVGDLVNPLHNSLNQLLTLHGQAPVFPGNIENESTPFLRKREHETKIRLTQPIFQPAIRFNAKIKKQMAEGEAAKVAVFKRQLKADIKTAYYTYLKTLRVKELLADTRLLLLENIRVSESLFRNHKRTEDVVFRSQAELGNLDAQLAEAEKNRQMAASYFNFLLNRPLDAMITIEADSGRETMRIEGFGPGITLNRLQQSALSKRREFQQLYHAIDAAGHAVKLQGASILPTVTAVLDYGFQGERYRFTGKDDYWMASLVLSWNLYRGGQDKAKRKNAELRMKQLQLQQTELQNKIRMQVKEAYYNLLAAQSMVKAYKGNELSRKEVFHIVSKKYKEGMVPQIEFVKARNDHTQASLQYIMARFDLYIKEAQMERAAAL